MRCCALHATDQLTLRDPAGAAGVYRNTAEDAAVALVGAGLVEFRTETRTVHDTSGDGSSAAEGHAGGDEALINAYLDALHDGRPELIVSGIDASLASHRVVFAAERARHTGTVVHL